jgi:hypothetical protein
VVSVALDPGTGGTSSASEPSAYPPAADGSGELVEVFVTVAVRTSSGPGPGATRLPREEASSLTGRRMAVTGSEPPLNWPG